MTKRKNLKMKESDWKLLEEIAADNDSFYREQPSWRRLILRIARGEITLRVVRRRLGRNEHEQEKINRRSDRHVRNFLIWKEGPDQESFPFPFLFKNSTLAEPSPSPITGETR
jgi:hypothetical protein